ncbi:PrsW family intramembrane metalloprotease [Fodinicola feengrottensis]|uniref:PrsW family intramembrane metalloprotease n=1 Tax=Fodinicola feengrottensis TaxID=435914 RepID=UPI0013D40126|nr:PrsW family intramembrane metalloprotease [Fodinicola feengrottensis]
MNAAVPGAYGAPAGPYPYQRLARPMHRTSVGKWLIGAAAAGFVGLAGLVVVVLLGLHYGPLLLLLFGLFAMFPVPILIGCAVWLSRFQPQPWGARLFALGWGATISVLIAGYANDFLQSMLFGGDRTLAAVFAAPLDEESLKGLALLLIFALSRTKRILPNAGRYFTGPLDGVAYALFVGAGFAFVENITYLASAFMNGQMQRGMASDGFFSLLLLFFVRCVLTPFGHPLFTSATGIALGFAARSNINIVIRVIAPVGGWMVAMMLHGFFNGSQAFVPSGLAGLVIEFTVVLPPVFLVWVAVVLFLRYNQFRIVRGGAGRLRPLRLVLTRGRRPVSLSQRAWGGYPMGQECRWFGGRRSHA